MSAAQKTLNQSTPVSIALVIGLCTGAYWGGSAVTELRVRMQAQENGHSQLEELTRELSKIATDNKRRLDLLENRQ